jgi:hypothetical protein
VTDAAKGGDGPVGSIAARAGQPARRAPSHASVPATWIRAGLGATTTVIATSLVFGVLVRVIAALTLSPHVDEPSSVLAAHVVARHGLPILPSGTPYFQGYTLSWLLAPFVWLGIGDIGQLTLMRMVLVLAGGVTIYLSYRLGQVLTGSASVGAVAALLVAIDPVSVQWSAHVRMYGLLQAVTIALVWGWVVLLRGDRSARQVALVVALYWAAVFTHVGAALLGPAMALAAVLVCGRRVVRAWRVLLALGFSALAPLTLLSLNRLLSPASEPARETVATPWWSFVGANLLAPLARLRLPLNDWQSRITAGITLYWLVPVVLVGASTIIGARLLLRRRSLPRETRVAVLTLLAFYWLPIVAIVVFTVSPKVRYLLHLHLLGYPFLGMLIAALLRRAARDRRRAGAGVAVVARYGAVAAIVLAIGAGLAWRLAHPIVQPDYDAAMAYVAEHHEAGQPIAVTLPPVAWLTLDPADRDDLHFLAGSEGWTRAERYTRLTEDGELIDYWVGVDSIVSTPALAALLDGGQDVWVVADAGRLRDDWTDASAIRELIRDRMYPVHVADGGAVVYRSKPPEMRSADADDVLAPQTGRPSVRLPW